MNKCNMNCYGKCQRKVYIDDRCILHCSKNDYQKDRNSGLLSVFYNELIDYTIEQLFLNRELLDDKYSKDEIITYLKSDRFENDEYNGALKKSIFIPNCIHFPKRDGRDTFDYLKILNLFGQIHFNYCEFYLSSLNLNNIECFFQDCKFNDRWTLYDYRILENEDNVIYQTCEFTKSVSNYTPDRSTELAIYNYSQFDYTCKFNKNLKFDRSIFKNRLFNTEQDNFLDENSIKILEFNKCVFEKEFKLNQYTIDMFIVQHSEFNDTFEFQNNSVNDIKIQNSEFEKVSVFTNSKFIDLYISDSVFNENIDFKSSIFGEKNDLTKIPTTFKSVIIHKSINFRDAKFYYGLDIPDTKINDLSSFLNADLAIEYTPRDTFRRLKHEFDSIGNIIEANKFYHKEMQKMEEELRKELPKSFLEWIVFQMHGIFSRHSQSWIRPIIWILLISLFCTANIQDNLIDTIFATYYSNILDNIANSINPFSIMTSKDPITFGLLIFKVLIAYLIYQFIISIRQNTRRK